jgi:hypothetical protein
VARRCGRALGVCRIGYCVAAGSLHRRDDASVTAIFTDARALEQDMVLFAFMAEVWAAEDAQGGEAKWNNSLPGGVY